MVSLGAPLGLLALLAGPLLVAAYFLRRRQPARIVSALFLWRTPDLRADAGPRLERFSRERSLLLELLAVAAAAVFLSDVRCGAAESQRHLVLVLDGSLSMQAGDKVSSAERAKTLAVKLWRDFGASTVTLIESGARPVVLAGPRASVKVAGEALEKWLPGQPAHDLTQTMRLAEQSADARAVFEVITDGAIDEKQLPRNARVHSVGEAANNFALTSVQRYDENGAATLIVRVANFAEKLQPVAVTFSTEATRHERSVDLAPGTSAVVRATLRTAGEVQVSLTADDALHADDRVTVLPAAPLEISIELAQGLDSAARAAISRFAERATTMVSKGGKNILAFGPHGSEGAMVTVGVNLKGEKARQSFVGPFFSQLGHPLLDDVHLAGVVWAANPQLVMPGRVLISAGSVVLMSEGDDGSVHLNLELARSNLQKSESWPVLLGNIVRAARARAAGLPRKHLMLGEEVPVVTTPGGTWSLRHSDGAVVNIFSTGAVTLNALPRAGRWALFKNGEEVDALEVMALDPIESDLRTRGPFEREPVSEEGPPAAFAGSTAVPRAVWPLTVMMLLVIADVVLTRNRR